jgi:YbbR domain-containing protein
MKRLFDLWQAKLGSILLAIVLYINLQNSKILVKNFFIPIEYPKLTQNLFYSKNSEKSYLVRLEGFKEIVNYHAQFMKAIVDPSELQVGENFVEIKKIYGVPSSGIKLTKLGQKIPIQIDILQTKTLPVDIVLDDEPIQGFIRSSIIIKPNTITVTGPKSVLEKLNKIALGNISLKDTNESFTRTLRIPDLPKNTTLIGNLKEFTLRVNIMKDLSSMGEQIIVQLPVKCESIDTSLEANLSVDEVSIKFLSTTKINSIQVIQGLQASVPCNYTYDKKSKKILPNSIPYLTKVKISKSNELKNIEVLAVSPEKILVSYKINPAMEKKETDDSNFPDIDRLDDIK